MAPMIGHLLPRSHNGVSDPFARVLDERGPPVCPDASLCRNAVS
ncbi:MAG: hypothetical protein OXE87_00020 [Chloroflexi bacterium]|nr:hypothetical protein [Chloroflexota bacterium]